MNILDRIIARKKEELSIAKEVVSMRDLERSPLFARQTLSLKNRLTSVGSIGIIAEHKRKSPSKGVINDSLTVDEVVTGYENAGAAAISVLTDHDFFGGMASDLTRARFSVSIPLLRKDFVIDEYQLLEAKAMGADVVLLIAACLSPSALKLLALEAHKLGLEVLMEVHDLRELKENLVDEIDMVGVNNRNLKDFSVSLDTSLLLAEEIPGKYVKVAESGLHTAADIMLLNKVGYKGFLIGESFMKTASPGTALSSLLKEFGKNKKSAR